MATSSGVVLSRAYPILVFGLYLLALVLAVATARGSRAELPGWWLRQARCIEWAESRATNARSNPVSRGYLQITWGTWRSVGGHGDPADASLREQRWRAFLIWRRDGGSWREWTTAKGCGLR